MMKHIFRYLLWVLVFVAAGLAPIAGQAVEPSFESFEAVPEVINLGNSSVRFQVKLFGLARIVGQFARLNGTLVNSNDRKTGSVQMRIDVSSVNTNDEGLDAYLRGPGFFNARQYPQINFSSSRLVIGTHGIEQIVGELSLHGTTKPVVFEVNAKQPASALANKISGYQAKATIKRSDFGLNSLKHIVSDEVDIFVAMQTDYAL